MTHKTPPAHLHAFTMVEIAVVLAIIALLVGGVMAGTSLVRSSRIQSAISDIRLFEGSFTNFQTKYNGIPGDMRNATTYWTAADSASDNNGLGSNCYNVNSATGTCNGNGNGKVGPGITTFTGYEDQWNEAFRLWQHLALSGFIPGRYEGSNFGGTVGSPKTELRYAAGTNLPASKLGPKGGYMMYYRENSTGAEDQYPIVGTMIVFGSYVANATQPSAILRGMEAWGMDLKLDDGLPGVGRVRSLGDVTTYPECVAGESTTAATSLAATYVKDSRIPGCILTFTLPEQ